MLAEVPVHRLEALELPAAAAAALGLGDRELRLGRAWPRGAGHLLLEYRTPRGTRVAGQWLGDAGGRGGPDPGRLARAARRTQAAAAGRGAVVALEAEGVLLQTGGADARLAPLAGLLRTPGTTLLSHRPERRAVVRVVCGDRVDYLKVVRPDATRGLVDAAGWSAGLEAAGLAVPRLLAADPHAGITLWSGLRGRALHDRLGHEALVDDAGSVGAALRALHGLRRPAALPRHAAHDEIRVLTRWLERLTAFARRPGSWLPPALATGAAARLHDVAHALATGAGRLAHTLVHRDLHDKQVFVSSSGAVGLIDLDTLSAGEPALDLANLLVHLELRALQGLVPPSRAQAAARAAAAAYAPGPDVVARLGAYADAARLRLACVYAFRPRWRACPPALLRRLGTPCPGLTGSAA